jgi:hypothetical protein
MNGKEDPSQSTRVGVHTNTHAQARSGLMQMADGKEKGNERSQGWWEKKRIRKRSQNILYFKYSAISSWMFLLWISLILLLSTLLCCCFYRGLLFESRVCITNLLSFLSTSAVLVCSLSKWHISSVYLTIYSMQLRTIHGHIAGGWWQTDTNTIQFLGHDDLTAKSRPIQQY